MLSTFIESHLEDCEAHGRLGLSGCGASMKRQPFARKMAASSSRMGRSGLVSTRPGFSGTNVQSRCDGARS